MSIDTQKKEPAVLPVVLVAPDHTWAYTFAFMVIWFVMYTVPVAAFVWWLLLPPLGLHWDYWTTLGAVFALRQLLGGRTLYQSLSRGTVGKGRRFLA